MSECDGTCVLIHNYRCGTQEWEHVMWGSPETKTYGRLTRGLKTAVERRAQFVYWGGGSDATTAYEYARGRSGLLQQYFGKAVETILNERSHIGHGGTRTLLEVSEALVLCGRHQLRRLIIVSDRVHLLRCFLFAMEQHKLLGLGGSLIIEPQWSETCFTDQDVIIFEPATTYRNNLHDVAQRLVELDARLGGNVADARDKLHALIETLSGKVG